MPDKITNIGYEAFMDCFLLDTLITLSENPPTLDDEVFLPNSDMVVFVPKGGSRNLVGIAIQLSDSEEEEFFVGYPMLISPEKFDFGIERFGCGI